MSIFRTRKTRKNGVTRKNRYLKCLFRAFPSNPCVPCTGFHGKSQRAGKIQLVKTWYDQEIILGDADFKWEFGQQVALALEVEGPNIRAFADSGLLFTVTDVDSPLMVGGIALLVTEGCAAAVAVTVKPL